MFIAPLIGLIIGLISGFLIPVNISLVSSKVLTIMVLTGADVIFSGANAKFSNEFDTLLFTNEFILNSIISIGLVYLGNVMGLDLFTPVALVLIAKMFFSLGTLNKKATINRKQSV